MDSKKVLDYIEKEQNKNNYQVLDESHRIDDREELEMHLLKSKDKAKQIFNILDEKIMTNKNIYRRILIKDIVYKNSNILNVVKIKLCKDKIIVFLRPIPDFIDPLNKFIDVEERSYRPLTKKITIDNNDTLEYIIEILNYYLKKICV